MYRALYRKWRPQKFCDVVGQEFVTTILENEVRSNKIGHAYLFIGSRGTGKTTCARIFAKAINCLSKESSEKPCGECSVCKALESQSLQDVIEIDAASNNGVNDIREICESTKFTPSVCKYKVYIIDEVHMLSTGAFNALLKTLEEPPPHVVFLLATTEVNKIPATILSRCQKFEFRKISLKNITKRVNFVAEEEGINLEENASDVIADCADGAMRDALSILDKCASLNNDVTEELVCSTLFIADKKYIFNICESIINKDLKNSLLLLDELESKSTSAQSIFSSLINFFSDLMVVKTASNEKEILNINSKFLERLESLASKTSVEDVLKILDILESFSENLPKAIDPKLHLKSFIVKACSKLEDKKANSISYDLNICKQNDLIERIENLERKIAFLEQQKQLRDESTSFTNFNKVKNDNLEAEKRDNSPDNNIKDNAEILKNAKEMSNWQEVLNTLKTVSPSVYTAFRESKAYISGPYVLIDSSKKLAFDLLKKSIQRDKIRDIIKRITGKLYRLGPYKKFCAQKESLDDGADGDLKSQSAVEQLGDFIKRAKDLGISVIEEDY